MKVGDLVIFKGSTCDSVGDPGVGTVIQILDRGSHRKSISAEFHWPRLSMINWQVKENLEVVNDT